MRSEHWFRWHHGCVTDPKWIVIAKRASSALSRNVTRCHVVSVWAMMLECASQSSPRGSIATWSDEDAAACLEIEEDIVREIRVAMQGKTLEGITLSNWNERQPKREDVNANRRKREERERKKSHDVTQCHTLSHNVRTETETETETDKKKTTQKKKTFELPEWVPSDLWHEWEAMRRKLRKPLVSDRARSMAISSLSKLRDAGHDPKRCIELAILNCWQSFYAPKDSANGSSGTFRDEFLSWPIWKQYGFWAQKGGNWIGYNGAPSLYDKPPCPDAERRVIYAKLRERVKSGAIFGWLLEREATTDDVKGYENVS